MLTKEEYDKLMQKYDGKCHICKRKDANCIDHDHNCCDAGNKSCGRCVRGVLCNDCNRGLGMFEDSPENLIVAAGYISMAE